MENFWKRTPAKISDNARVILREGTISLDFAPTASRSRHSPVDWGEESDAGYGVGPLWALVLCFRRFRASARVHALQAGLYLAGWGLLLAYCYSDPHRFVTWYLD